MEAQLQFEPVATVSNDWRNVCEVVTTNADCLLSGNSIAALNQAANALREVRAVLEMGNSLIPTEGIDLSAFSSLPLKLVVPFSDLIACESLAYSVAQSLYARYREPIDSIDYSAAVWRAYVEVCEFQWALIWRLPGLGIDLVGQVQTDHRNAFIEDAKKLTEELRECRRVEYKFTGHDGYLEVKLYNLVDRLAEMTATPGLPLIGEYSSWITKVLRGLGEDQTAREFQQALEKDQLERLATLLPTLEDHLKDRRYIPDSRWVVRGFENFAYKLSKELRNFCCPVNLLRAAAMLQWTTRKHGVDLPDINKAMADAVCCHIMYYSTPLAAVNETKAETHSPVKEAPVTETPRSVPQNLYTMDDGGWTDG